MPFGAGTGLSKKYEYPKNNPAADTQAVNLNMRD
jgi:hypothetical protein